MGKEEAMRLILSLPGTRSNVYFNKISLDSNRLKKGILKKENVNDDIYDKNLLEIYMDRSES